MKSKMPRARKPYNQTKAYWRKERHWYSIMYDKTGIPEPARERFIHALQAGYLDKDTERWVLDDFPIIPVPDTNSSLR